MSLRFAGPYRRRNGPCPYLDDREWSADYLLSDGDVDIEPRNDILLGHNTFQEAVPESKPIPCEVSGTAPIAALGRLLALGFRRAGRMFYRPACGECQECVSLRVDVNLFSPTGDQRRALRKNRDVELEIGMPRFADEKFALYAKFVRERYPCDDLSLPGYHRYFLEHFGNTREFRYRVGGTLVGLGIVDLVADAVSSVYFFFDPAQSTRSLGTYSVLREIDFCRQSGRRYVYLGFRVAGCRAMRYKSLFRPHELLSPTRGWVSEEAWATDDAL